MTTKFAERSSPTRQGRSVAWSLMLVVGGVAVLALSSKTQVPFWPVPLTLQTLAICVLAMAYGARLGASTLAAYLTAGALGLPVFAGTPEKGIGLAYMAGPTGGYLVGFLLAAALMGWMADRGWGRGVVRAAVAMTVGHSVILLLGTLWLGNLIGGEAAVNAGLMPFLWPSLIKIALGAMILVGGAAALDLLDRR